MLSKVEKTKVVEDNRLSPEDTGSPEVQVALLSQRISELTGHLNANKRDFSSRVGLMRLVGRRKRLLAYLKKEDLPIVLPPPPAVAPDVLYYPLNEGRHYITQYFGENPQWYPTSRGHNGIDWGIPVGNPIYATQDGVVITAVTQTTGYGRHVRIQHHNGISIYGHLSVLGVTVGQQVHARQEIGKSGGATTDPYCGYSTGPHLHFEFRPTEGAPQVPGGYVYGAIDPMPLLASHDYDGTPDAVLFRAECTAYLLNVRYGPGTGFYTNGKLTSGQIRNVYEIKDGWYRISDQCQRWCAGWYTERLNDPVYTYYIPAVNN